MRARFFSAFFAAIGVLFVAAGILLDATARGSQASDWSAVVGFGLTYLGFAFAVRDRKSGTEELERLRAEMEQIGREIKSMREGTEASRTRLNVASPSPDSSEDGPPTPRSGRATVLLGALVYALIGGR